jgi:hypothetical protein
MEDLRRYFLDTEFYPDADGHSHVISIGLIEEKDKGRGFYAIASEFNEAACTNDWVNEHVVAKLRDHTPRLSRKEMAEELVAYIKPAEKIEFWARNGSYDFYHLCQTFKTMDGFFKRLNDDRGAKRVYFRDINEILRVAGNPKLPKAPDDTAHIAIVDATWDRDRFAEIERLAALNSARPLKLLETAVKGLRCWMRGPE